MWLCCDPSEIHSKNPLEFHPSHPCSKCQQEPAPRGTGSTGLSGPAEIWTFWKLCCLWELPFLRQLPHHLQACISSKIQLAPPAPQSYLVMVKINQYLVRSDQQKDYFTGEEEGLHREWNNHLPVGLRISDSGNSSKFEVSSMLLISIEIAAGLSLPRRADEALRFQRQTKHNSATFHFLTESRLKVPKPQQASGREHNALTHSWMWQCQSAAPCCTPGLARAVPREEQLLFCKASYLMCSQSTPSKNGLLFISSTPDAPILCSHSQQNLGWKEEWKWRENENESIPSRNGTAFWTDTAAVS